jgi:hypothetical protein
MSSIQAAMLSLQATIRVLGWLVVLCSAGALVEVGWRIARSRSPRRFRALLTPVGLAMAGLTFAGVMPVAWQRSEGLLFLCAAVLAILVGARALDGDAGRVPRK